MGTAIAEPVLSDLSVCYVCAIGGSPALHKSADLQAKALRTSGERWSRPTRAKARLYGFLSAMQGGVGRAFASPLSRTIPQLPLILSLLKDNHCAKAARVLRQAQHERAVGEARGEHT